MIPLVIAEYFGVRLLGKVFGVMTFAETIGGGTLNIVTGHLFDRTGSYQFPFRIVVLAAFASLVFMIWLSRRAPRLQSS